MASPPLIHEVTNDIDQLLNELKTLVDPSDVEDPDAGLRWQYQVGLVDKNDIIELIDFRRKLNKLIDQGLWRP